MLCPIYIKTTVGWELQMRIRSSMARMKKYLALGLLMTKNNDVNVCERVCLPHRHLCDVCCALLGGGLWSGPWVWFSPEALYACGGDTVVPFSRAAAGSQSESELEHRSGISLPSPNPNDKLLDDMQNRSFDQCLGQHSHTVINLVPRLLSTLHISLVHQWFNVGLSGSGRVVLWEWPYGVKKLSFDFSESHECEEWLCACVLAYVLWKQQLNNVYFFI